jgi:hypothetical protein
MSPGLTSASSLTHQPSVTNVRLLRPLRARLATLICAGSKKLGNGTPQPVATPSLLAAVESPAMNTVGSFGSSAAGAAGCSGGGGGAAGVCARAALSQSPRQSINAR